MSDSFVTPWTVARQAPLPMGLSRQEYLGVGNQSLLQGIFLIQGSNTGLLYCRQILYHLSHQGSPLGTFRYNSHILLLSVKSPKLVLDKAGLYYNKKYTPKSYCLKTIKVYLLFMQGSDEQLLSGVCLFFFPQVMAVIQDSCIKRFYHLGVFLFHPHR